MEREFYASSSDQQGRTFFVATRFLKANVSITSGYLHVAVEDETGTGNLFAESSRLRIQRTCHRAMLSCGGPTESVAE